MYVYVCVCELMKALICLSHPLDECKIVCACPEDLSRGGGGGGGGGMEEEGGRGGKKRKAKYGGAGVEIRTKISYL